VKSIKSGCPYLRKWSIGEGQLDQGHQLKPLPETAAAAAGVVAAGVVIGPLLCITVFRYT